MGRLTYFIVQIQLDEDGHQVCRQTYAVYHNKNFIKDLVKHNYTDINETCFNYVCIEGLEDSVCPIIDDGVVYRQFYKFNYDTSKYEECEVPEIYKDEDCSLAI